MYNIKVLIFITFLLVLPGVYTIHAHTDLENAKTDYSLAASEYAIAYGKWETAERIKGDLENSLEVTVSEWNSNLEDIEENIIDAMGWKALDIANAIKQGAKTVRDLFDNKSLSQVRQEKQAEIDNIALTIPQLVSERDEKEKAYEQAKIRYQSFQHLCSGCNNLIDELSQEGHRSQLCGNNHTYYECNKQGKWLHTNTFYCYGCRISPLLCVSEQHIPGPCMSCGDTFYSCSWGTCYFGPHPNTSSVITCLYPACLGGYNLSITQAPYPPHHHYDSSDSEEEADAGSTTPTTPTPVYPTVPDRPGSFSLTSGYISIQLSWTSSTSDGGSAITAYEYQYQSSTNGRLSWSSWSDWTSGGTDNFTLIQGLSRGTDYSVRMRAVNSVGTSTVTGQHIVRTRND